MSIETQDLLAFSRSTDFIPTCYCDEVMVAPADLVRVFGKPDESDGYKVSGEYKFTGKDGTGFTLYDWKSTSLYDGGTLTPEEFWKMEELWCMQIGAVKAEDQDASEFKSWLMAMVSNCRIGR